jgi:hypothetical protein
MNSLAKFKTLAVGASLLAVVATASANTLQASFTYGPDTFYLYSAPGASWDSDEIAANLSGGYLAILPNQTTIEAVYNGLINNNFFQGGNGGSQQVEAYIGAVPADGSSSTTSRTDWSWVTTPQLYNGTPVTSVVPWTVGANFNAGEPNGDSEGLAINRYGTYTFNDEGSYTGGYIEEVGPIAGVPDAGLTSAMLGAGVFGMGFIRRRLTA